MKLVYILKWFPKASETFVLDELLAQQRAGVAMTIFSLFASPDSSHQDYVDEFHYPVHYVPEGSLEEKANWVAARCNGATHLHAHFAASATSVAMKVSAQTGIPFSFTAYARDIFHDSVSRDELAEKVSRARFCLTVSCYNRDYLRGLSPSADVRLLRTGLSLDRFPFRPLPREQFVLGVGRLVPKKGFDALDAACPERFPLHIIGDGPERPRVHRATLHGFLPRSITYTWICRAGLLVLPCRIAADGDRDGIPTVLCEGMAAGTPVLSTRVVGIPEVCPFLVAPDDLAALRDAISEMMAQPPRQDVLWQSRAWIEENCDVDKQMEVLRSFL